MVDIVVAILFINHLSINKCMGIFQAIITKYKDAKQKTLNKKEFKGALLKAASDGKITVNEIEEFDKKKSELGLTEEDVKHMKALFEK